MLSLQEITGGILHTEMCFQLSIKIVELISYVHETVHYKKATQSTVGVLVNFGPLYLPYLCAPGAYLCTRCHLFQFNLLTKQQLIYQHFFTLPF